ncbi:Efflux transporter outer membrane subunit [Acetobacteraceae bacterium EV16G]|uniref:Efflux transporter outer membrane subunit n=1 Tax=Sorlinia euscelidii TaxID=3081148 RepID=A0ABU7U529_9PROT
MSAHRPYFFNARLKLIAGFFCLTSCAVGPDFKSPEMHAPARYGQQKAADQTYAAAVDTRWWRAFRDPELNSLVSRLARQNLDLKQGLARIDQAGARVRIARSQGLPNLDWTGSYSYVHQSKSGFVSLVTRRPDAPTDYNFFQNTLGASWDLDLFGRVRRMTEAQRASQLAATERRHALALSVVARLSDTYMQLRGVQDVLRVTRATRDIAKSNLKLVGDRYREGANTTADLARARGEVTAIDAMIPPLQNSETQLINAIGLLLAEPPEALAVELRQPDMQPAAPPTVPTGLPSALAHRRPDIREAEAQLHAATAEIGAAKASFYPDIILNGQVGTQTLSAQQFFSMPARQFTTGPSLVLPIFEGGRLSGNLRLTKAAQKQAALQYRQTVLTAWNEVDNALSAYQQFKTRHAVVAETLREARKTLSATRQQYREGATDYLDVNSALRDVLAGEAAFAESRTEINVALVALYKALGGGWDYADGANGHTVTPMSE